MSRFCFALICHAEVFLVSYLHIVCCHFVFENDGHDGDFFHVPVPEKFSWWPFVLFRYMLLKIFLLFVIL